jgi:general secretion pathway protein G
MYFSYNKKAFTLLELLVVISILAILTAIAIPKIKGMRQNANLLKASKEMDAIMLAIESYRTFGSSSAYPPSSTRVVSAYLLSASPNMINSAPYDPFGATSTTEYNYLLSANGKYYVVWTAGLTGQDQPIAISNTGVISY